MPRRKKDAETLFDKVAHQDRNTTGSRGKASATPGSSKAASERAQGIAASQGGGALAAWDESKHPRVQAGSDAGGEFAPKGSAITTAVEKGKDFQFDGNYDVKFSNGKRTQIFYDKASQNWYENKQTKQLYTSHYSDIFGNSKQELLDKLTAHYASK